MEKIDKLKKNLKKVKKLGEAWLELKTYVFNQQHLTTGLLHNYCFLLHLDLFLI
jgi:hypothetical protein